MDPGATVYIVDDDQAVRNGISDLVEEMGSRACSFSSAREFLQSYEPRGPECLVLDVRMPEMNGLELLAKLAKRDIRIPVVIITGHGDIQMAVDALQLGAIDFVEKPFREEKLWGSIQKGVEASGKQMSLRSKQKEIEAAITNLTRRERQVAVLLLEGNSDKATGAALDVSRRAIAFHRGAILEKLSFGSVTEMAGTVVRLKIEI